MRKILSAVLALTLILTATMWVPVSGEDSAELAETYGALSYEIKSDNTIEIAYCDYSATVVTIPPEIDGLPVTSIGYGAFGNRHDLTSVSIPSSVASISNLAFYDCGNLNINVSANNNYYSSIDGVLFNKDKTEIVAYAKDKIQQEYTIPNSVTSIGNWTFERCTGLTSVNISISVTSIGDEAFSDCTALTDVYYSGAEAQWDQIAIGEYNDELLNANIHFMGSAGDVGIANVTADKASRKISADFQNLSGESETFIAICALYDASGALITYEDTEATVAAGETRKIEFLMSADDWDSYKLFAWDDFGSLRPLSVAAN